MPTDSYRTAKTAKLRSAKRLAKLKSLAARRFRDRNRRFNKLSVDKQRIKIIRDVITHLKTEKLKAAKGNYLKVLGVRKVAVEQQLHEIMEQSQCQVCGIGAVFTTTVLLNNDLKVKAATGLIGSVDDTVNLAGAHMGDSPMRKYLSKWFDNEQLSLIEVAFETTTQYTSSYRPKSWKTLDAAVTFGKKYRNTKDRLIAICENILENEGKFVPPRTDVIE